MARRRFFVDEVRRGEAELDGEDAEHLTRVLRAEVGQQYEICDGARLYLSEVIEARKHSVRFRVLEELPAVEPAVRISLLMSLIKFERFEWMVEKATELGVETIVPVQAERSDKRLDRSGALSACGRKLGAGVAGAADFTGRDGCYRGGSRVIARMVDRIEFDI